MQIKLAPGQEFTNDGIAPDMGALQEEHAKAFRSLTGIQNELHVLRSRETAAINELNAVQRRIDGAIGKLKSAAPPNTDWASQRNMRAAPVE